MIPDNLDIIFLQATPETGIIDLIQRFGLPVALLIMVALGIGFVPRYVLDHAIKREQEWKEIAEKRYETITSLSGTVDRLSKVIDEMTAQAELANRLLETLAKQSGK